MTDHGQNPLPGPAAMHVAVSTAHGTQSRTEKRAHRVQHRFAKGQPSGQVANQRREDISFSQRESDGNTQGFLPAAQKDAAVNLTRAVKAGEFFIQRARQQHPATRLDIFVAERGEQSAGFRAGNSLKHATYLAALAPAVQTFLSARWSPGPCGE